MSAHSLRGIAMALFAAMLWGTTGTAQSLAPSQLSSFWIGTLRLVAAASFFAPWLLLTDRGALALHALRPLPWRGIIVAAICMSAYNLAFFAGVRFSGVAVGTAIALGSGPVWAGVLQAVAGGRLPRLGWWLGTCLAVTGVALMVAEPDVTGGARAAGIGLCLLAGFAYASFALVSKRMVAGASPSTVTALVFTLAALMTIPCALVLAGVPAIGSNELVVVAWLGVMSTGVAYLLFSHALRYVSGATGVALGLAEPVTAFVLAIVVVGERPGAAAFAGLIAVLAGLLVVIRAEVSGAERQ